MLVLLAASFIVYGYRIRIEEKALVERFGEEYRVYMKETKMLIPGVV
jgi:protein-S-isoprenylcysteine O-methyltransferase Ste14